MTTVGLSTRERILRYASGLLTPDDRQEPVKVAAAALPLLEWAEQAADNDDLEARMHAMSQHHVNTHDARERSPGQFVDEAEILYAFLVGGGSGG
jgi:hypothetical protein